MEHSDALQRDHSTTATKNHIDMIFEKKIHVKYPSKLREE